MDHMPASRLGDERAAGVRICGVDFVHFARLKTRLPATISRDSRRRMMSRAQQKSSPTEEHARAIARVIGKGLPPRFSADLDHYCESSPREIFAAFAAAARHMPPAGKDEVLALGYLFLLQRLLEHLRYRADRGYADAAELIA